MTLAGGYEAALLVQARQTTERHDYGLARYLLENLITHIGREHPEFLEANVLWARSCGEMNDAECAIEIARPIYAALRDGRHLETLNEIEHWLWNANFSEEYHKDLDDTYQWALELNLDLISKTSTPDGVLAPLRTTTRWLEILGQDVRASMIRELIRKEAPGTKYVDSHDRRNYVRQVTLTEKMEAFLKAFDVRVKTEIVAKLKEVMGSEHLMGSENLRNNGDTNPLLLSDPASGGGGEPPT